MKLGLAVIIATIATALGTIATASPAGGRSNCITPRLFALTLPTARLRIAAAGCRLGGISWERPRTRPFRVTDQIPPPGALLPAGGRVFLIAS